MIDLISKHYQWIFSGIGVLIITILYNIIKKKHDSKDKFSSNKISNKDSEEAAIHIGNKVVNNFNIESNSEQNKTTPIISNIEATEIRRRINESAPFQKKQIASNYIGVKIKWDITLQAVHEPKDNLVNVMSFYKESYPWIYFTIDIDKYPIFKIAEVGKKFTIIGIISNTDGATFEIEIEKIIEN